MTAGRARDEVEAGVTVTTAPQEWSAQTWQEKGDYGRSTFVVVL